MVKEQAEHLRDLPPEERYVALRDFLAHRGLAERADRFERSMAVRSAKP
jgi:hypothetical protein